MKKVIIGSTFLLSGIIITMCILITGVMQVPTVGSWSGSRLMTTISVIELQLPFYIGIFFCLIGLVILVIELFTNKDKSEE